MRIHLFDTETTGLKEPIEPIELAWLELDEAFNIVAQQCERFKPSKAIEYGALSVSHILPQELDDYPPFTECRLPETDYVIGHNVDYDWKVIGQPKVKRICTKALSCYLWPEVDSHTQSAMLYVVNGVTEETRDLLKEAHSALADVYNCHLLLLAILDKSGVTTVEELYELSEKARIPTIMGFGKYKDLPIEKVPSDYVAWYRRQASTDPYYLEAFRRAGK